MRRILLAIAIVAALPLASATSGFSSQSLGVLGDARISGDAAALFALSEGATLSWQIFAEEATIERSYVEYSAVDHPAREAPSYLYRRDGELVVDTESYHDARLTGSAARPMGAFLLRAQPGTTTLDAYMTLDLSIRSEGNPRFDQGPPPDVSSDENRRTATLHESIQGNYLNMSAERGVIEIVGDFVLDLNDVDYVLETAEGRAESRTGQYETERAGPVATGRRETHRIHLSEATLVFTPTSPTYVFSTQARLNATGELHAIQPRGEFPLPGSQTSDASPGTLAWQGRGELLLAPGHGAVEVAAADSGLGASGAVVARPPALTVAFAAALAFLSAEAVGAALALIRRGRRGDDLELALLAMEERRWGDALPRLNRALAKRPHDAVLLLDKALCLEHLGRLREAASNYEAALRSAPRNAETHFYYARALAKMREREPSRIHLEQALELDPRLLEMAQRERAFRA